MRWRPLSTRSDAASIEEYDSLHEGVPPWLARGAGSWVVKTVKGGPYRADPTETLHVLEQLLRFPLDWRYGSQGALESLANEVAINGARALDVIDGLLAITSNWNGSWQMRESLDSMLRASGSAWAVSADVAGRPCLQRRVDPVVEQAARAEMAEASRAAQHVGLAWDKVYGRSMDASGGYREAVRAVEAAARPIVTPNDPLATLGKMIRALTDKPEKWTVAVGSVQSLVEMLNQLWTSQLDRHGTDDESRPLSVSAEQAEAAVHLALTLVHWFRSGAIRLV